ncbi:MAG: bestrophin-like domain [Chromatiales bacterium]
MSDWLHNLPVAWMALVVFGVTYLVTAGIYRVVLKLAAGDRARALKGLSPGMLPPLGIIFGLLVGFIAAQVWSDLERAKVAVNREARALRGIVLLAASFPGEPEGRLRTLVRRHIKEAATREWPDMARQHATLAMIPASLTEALQLTLALTPENDGQKAAQHAIATSLQEALDARRQRIIISQSSVNWVKWTGLLLQAICTLVAIAMVHSDNRTTCAIAMTLFATGIALSVLLIASHNRPFTGEIGVGPEVLLQVMPPAGTPALHP